MGQINKLLREYWSNLLLLLAGLIGVIFVIWFRIVTIPNGYSSNEWIVRNNLVNKRYNFLYLWHHVSYAPYNLALMVPQYLDRYGLFSVRSVGAFFGLLSVGVFFYIIWRWWGTLIAILSTILFVSDFWFLQTARNEGPVVLYILAALIIIALGFVVRNKKNHDTKTLFSALLGLILLYIPGMIWFVIAACVLQRKFISNEFKKLPIQVKLIIPIAGLIFITPLIHACFVNINVLKTILGFPIRFSIHVFLINLVHWPLIIFIRNPVISSYSLGHLPVLSIFNDIMFVLGLYWIWIKRNLDRFYLLGATLVLSWVLYALGGTVSIYLGLPFIMCIAATGMAFIIGEWFSVFPRNPLARAVGISILTVAVLAVCLYHFDQYFIAWPKASTTLSLYSTHT